jgi:hypothetical protein
LLSRKAAALCDNAALAVSVSEVLLLIVCTVPMNEPLVLKRWSPADSCVVNAVPTPVTVAKPVDVVIVPVPLLTLASLSVAPLACVLFVNRLL